MTNEIPQLRIPDRTLDLNEQAFAVRQTCLIVTTWLQEHATDDGNLTAVHQLYRQHDPLRRMAQPLDAHTRLDVAELSRRLDRALAAAIESARARGKLQRRGESAYANPLPTLQDYGIFTLHALIGRMYHGVTDKQFEMTLQRCRAAGDLRRPTVAAALTGKPLTTRPPDELTPVQKVTRLRDLATEGHHSSDIAAELGVTAEYVRLLARRHNIELRGDIAGPRRRVNPVRVISQTVDLLDGARQGLDLLTAADLDGLNPDQCAAWATALTDSVRGVRALIKELNNRA